MTVCFLCEKLMQFDRDFVVIRTSPPTMFAHVECYVKRYSVTCPKCGTDVQVDAGERID